MNLTEIELRAVHTDACATVLKTNRAVTPADDAFWPLYIQALLDATGTSAMLSLAERAVIAERRRQVEVEGWTDAHDDEHAAGTLALAAAAYALDAGEALEWGADASDNRPEPMFWPFSSSWWKPTTPRHSLVKAAALILGEIERMNRDPGDESIHHHINGGDNA